MEQIAIVMQDTHYEAWNQGLIALVEAEGRGRFAGPALRHMRAVLPQSRLAACAVWRDNRLMTLMAHARAQA